MSFGKDYNSYNLCMNILYMNTVYKVKGPYGEKFIRKKGKEKKEFSPC